MASALPPPVCGAFATCAGHRFAGQDVLVPFHFRTDNLAIVVYQPNRWTAAAHGVAGDTYLACSPAPAPRHTAELGAGLALSFPISSAALLRPRGERWRSNSCARPCAQTWRRNRSCISGTVTCTCTPPPHTPLGSPQASWGVTSTDVGYLEVRFALNLRYSCRARTDSYRRGELSSLFDHLPCAEVVESYFDAGNWCVRARKVCPQLPASQE